VVAPFEGELIITLAVACVPYTRNVPMIRICSIFKG